MWTFSFHFISYNLVKSVTLYREITITFTRVLVKLVLTWSPDMTPASQIENIMKKVSHVYSVSLSGMSDGLIVSLFKKIMRSM